MKVAEYGDIVQWIGSVGLSVDQDRALFHVPVTASSVKIPDRYSRIVVMLKVLIGLEPDESFDVTALWITHCDIWDEREAEMLFNRVRSAASGDPRDMNVAPAMIFDPDEFDDFFLLALLAILGAWDGYIIPKHGRFFFALSHDGFVDMVYRDPRETEKMNHILKEMKFAVSPQGAEEFYVKNGPM